MKTSCQYIVERHTHGWLICAATGKQGVTCNALDECMPLFKTIVKPIKDAGIAHHFNTMYSRPPVIFAVASTDAALVWRMEIEDRIKHMAPEYRWWYGTDTGMSSATIFGVLDTRTDLRGVVAAQGCGSVPMDADDFARCVRLLQRFPLWRERLGEVADAFPLTAWPRIVDRWDELEKADPNRQCFILNECSKPVRPQ